MAVVCRGSIIQDIEGDDGALGSCGITDGGMCYLKHRNKLPLKDARDEMFMAGT